MTQVGFIRRVAEDQLRLVGDLLDIAKIEAGRLELELGDVSVAELFVPAARPAAAAAARAPMSSCASIAAPDLPPLRTDEGKLMQVLRNLVSNALKFTPAGEVVVGADAHDGVVRFEVRDTGIGIAPEDLPRIFAEFVQIPGELQRNGHGTGLGLPLASARRAARRRDRREQRLGEGTTFTVVAAGGRPIAPRRRSPTLRRRARRRRRRDRALRRAGPPARHRLAGHRGRVRDRGAGGVRARACRRR